MLFSKKLAKPDDSLTVFKLGREMVHREKKGIEDVEE